MGTASYNCSILKAIFNWKDTPPPKDSLCRFQGGFFLNRSNMMNHTLMFLSFLLCCCSTPGSKVVKQVLALPFQGELFVKYIKYPVWDLSWHDSISVWRRYILRIKCIAVLLATPSLDCAMCSFGRPQGLLSIHCHPLVYKLRRWSGLSFTSLFKEWLLGVYKLSLGKLFQVYKGWCSLSRLSLGRHVLTC